jgi:hypothetical protein
MAKRQSNRPGMQAEGGNGPAAVKQRFKKSKHWSNGGQTAVKARSNRTGSPA